MIQRIIILLLSLLLFPKGNIPIAIHHETILTQPKTSGITINIVIPDLTPANDLECNCLPVATQQALLTGNYTTDNHKRITGRRPIPSMTWTRTRPRKWPLKNMANDCRKIEREKNTGETGHALIYMEVWIVQLNKKGTDCKRHGRRPTHPRRENELNTIRHNHPITELSMKV